MKKIIVALALIYSISGHARLNDTLVQCENRYGKGKMIVKDELYEYVKNGWWIMINFFDGRCDRIVYMKLRNKDKSIGKISDFELNILLKNNGENWNQIIFYKELGEGQDIWQTKNGSIAARNFAWHHNNCKGGNHAVTFKAESHSKRQRISITKEAAEFKALRETYQRSKMKGF